MKVFLFPGRWIAGKHPANWFEAFEVEVYGWLRVSG
jgi:hypothetical protein